MSVDSETELVAEINRLSASIDRAATATEITLAGHPPPSADDDPHSSAERTELGRQLTALRERVAVAKDRNEGARALRAELATLWFFARTLQADAHDWRSALKERAQELERQRAVARKERERLAAERERRAAAREKLVRRRDTLQLTVLQTAARLAQQYRGDCRRTVPVVTIGEGLTVCSVSVSCPRRGFRFAKQWLVTLNRSHDVLVRRD